MLDQLRERSQERIEQSPEFEELQETIARYLEFKERKSVTLNEEVFLAERAEWEALRHIDEALEEEEEEPDVVPVVVRDYYFEEVLDITVDYVRSLNGHRVARLN